MGPPVAIGWGLFLACCAALSRLTCSCCSRSRACLGAGAICGLGTLGRRLATAAAALCSYLLPISARGLPGGESIANTCALASFRRRSSSSRLWCRSLFRSILCMFCARNAAISLRCAKGSAASPNLGFWTRRRFNRSRKPALGAAPSGPICTGRGGAGRRTSPPLGGAACKGSGSGAGSGCRTSLALGGAASKSSSSGSGSCMSTSG